jgi:hypothetical protein
MRSIRLFTEANRLNDRCKRCFLRTREKSKGVLLVREIFYHGIGRCDSRVWDIAVLSNWVDRRSAIQCVLFCLRIPEILQPYSLR